MKVRGGAQAVSTARPHKAWNSEPAGHRQLRLPSPQALLLSNVSADTSASFFPVHMSSRRMSPLVRVAKELKY